MKRTIFTLLLVAITTLSFGQVPKHLRVLNYVPDDCYSLTLVNLDTLSRVCELEALHRDGILKPIYDSVKISKNLVMSWIKKDKKIGIDFTATAAIITTAYSNVYLIPLNNERNFEKALRSFDKTLPPFETLTDPEGRKIRYTVPDEAVDYFSTVICTDNVACIVLFNDPFSLFSSEWREETISSNDSLRLWWSTPKGAWLKMSHSNFVNSEVCTKMLAGEYDAYYAYNANNQSLKLLDRLLVIFPGSEMLPTALRNMDLTIYNKSTLYHDKWVSVNEMYNNGPSPILKNFRQSPEELQKLFPYMSENSVTMFTSTWEHVGETIRPYLDAMPEAQELASLMNKPFFLTVSMDEGMLFGTLLENPAALHDTLERYVAAHNRTLDTLFERNKKRTADQKSEFAKIMAEGNEYQDFETYQNEESDSDWDIFEEIFSYGSDSISNRKTLFYEKRNGWDVYYLLTSHFRINFDSYEQELNYDTTYIIAFDNFLFYSKEPAVFNWLRNPQPYSTPLSEEQLQHPLYMRIDLNTAAAALGMDMLPLRDLVIYSQDNTMVMNLNAEPGLHHGIFYELVKFVIDFVRNF